MRGAAEVAGAAPAVTRGDAESACTNVRARLVAVPSPRARVLIAAASSALLLACSAATIAAEGLGRSDVPEYYGFAQKAGAGKVPYRDFAVEYPPGALPTFLLPAHDIGPHALVGGRDLAPHGGAKGRRYAGSFAVLMGLLAMLTLLVTAASLSALGASLGRTLLACGVVATSPLALGTPVEYGHYDLWPAFLSAGAIAALVRGRGRLAGVAVGLGTAAKVYPVLLLPIVVSSAWKTHGRREAGVVLALAAGTTLAVVLPFLALAPAGTSASLRDQLARGVQIESNASAVVVGLDRLVSKVNETGIGLPTAAFRVAPSSMSGVAAVEIHGQAVDVLAGVMAVLAVGLLVALWVGFARSGTSRERAVLVSAATLVAAVVLGRVLSTQYLVWLVPVVPLVAGRRGLVATILLEGALVLTHWWWSDPYFTFVALLTSGTTGLLLLRNALLVAVLAVLVWPRPSASTASSSDRSRQV